LLFELFLLFLIPFAYGEVPDYDDPFAPIFFDKPSYTWTDKIKITILAPSWNTDRNLIDSIGGDSTHPVKVSTRSESLEPYRLTETSENSGMFSGEIILSGFLHDVDGDGDFDTTPRTIGSGPTSGFLESERDSAITVSFEFADGVVLSESVPVTWNVGVIQFTKEIFLSDDIVSVRLIDKDMNLNPEAVDNVEIEIFSESDVGGISVNAAETGDSTGMFVIDFSLSQTSTSSGNRLYALPGDEIFATYDDYTLPKPHSISDKKEIKEMAIVESSIIPTSRIDNGLILFTNSLGDEFLSHSKNNQVQIVGTITNQQEYDQKFVYFFQVKNPSGNIESLSWIQGKLSPKQTLDVSQSWNPQISGVYTIETFVWDSFSDLLALGPTSSTEIIVE
jgi:hypothetical protein